MNELEKMKYMEQIERAKSARVLAEIVFNIYYDNNLGCEEKNKLYHAAFVTLYNHVRLTDAEKVGGEDE